MISFCVIVFAALFGRAFGQDAAHIKFLLLFEDGQNHFVDWFEDSLKSNEINADRLSLDVHPTIVQHEAEDEEKICNGFSEDANIVIDVTWTGNQIGKDLSTKLNVPYVRIDLSISPFLHLMDEYLNLRNSTDVVVIFDNMAYLDQALYYWIDSTILRMIISGQLDKVATNRLKNMRPIPNTFAIIADTKNMASMFQTAIQEDIVPLPERWNLIFSDFNYKNFPSNLLLRLTSLLKLDHKVCCKLLELQECDCPTSFVMAQAFLDSFAKSLIKILNQMASQEYNLEQSVACESKFYDETTSQHFEKLLLGSSQESTSNFYLDKGVYKQKIIGTVEIAEDGGYLKIVGRYNENQELIKEDDVKVTPITPFYRIGIVEAVPWTYQFEDPDTGELKWTGYCIDFIEKLSEMMGFKYELIVPQNGTFGKKDAEGKWDGIVGDIARGETDMAVSALIMTADREEVIDYVAPYFENSGISIVMRKPVRKTSLFKFMTVLKLEVWLSIVAALVITALMIWFLDKYSPYSAKNNKKAYPYICREFTMKESFWFALTSFTPQGGGEAPKSLSARTLVAAYWLFVVLMLATFTANLAAFLTVERMQTPVQSLEQLAKQSRINYTVIKDSLTHQYFINMKYAEDTLYRMWKELTLNASTDEVRYRVWDYPIKEQYGHILLSINESMPVANGSEGFRIVNERLDGDFAFIHDSSEIKYEISRNCNLTEVGEVFAEKPYAIAVQQGSHLQDQISIKILDLQRDRFFEHLQAKYWNNSIRGDCSTDIDSEGITLESLGGVFIATLFGLALAMVTLGFEVLYYRRKSKNKNQKFKEAASKVKEKNAKMLNRTSETVTIGKTFKPVARNKLTPNVSHISVYPRGRLPHIN